MTSPRTPRQPRERGCFHTAPCSCPNRYLSEVLPETPEPPQEELSLLGWALPDHLAAKTITTARDTSHHVVCRHISHEGGFPGWIFGEGDSERARFAHHLNDHAHVPASQSVPAVPVSSTAGTETGEGDEDAQGVAEPDYVTVPVTPQYVATRAIANIIDEHFGDDYEEAAWAAAEEIVRQGYAYPRLSSPLSREELGHRVAEVCLKWSREDDEREGATATWEALNSHRRELYMRVGEALFGLGMTFSPAPRASSWWEVAKRWCREKRHADWLLSQWKTAAGEQYARADAAEAKLAATSSPLPDGGPLSGVALRDVEERDDASEKTQ